MAETRLELIEHVRSLLKDADDDTWSDAELAVYINQCVLDIEKIEPKLNRAVLAVVDDSKKIDISGLTSYKDILRVEYPVDNDIPYYHTFEIVGDYVFLRRSSIIDADEGTLTGTITFTESDCTVSGSGTAFTTELAAGNFIRISTGTQFYQIESITDDDALELSVPFAETTATDTEDLTVYRKNAIAYVYWTGPYTLADSATDLPDKMDAVLIAGGVAKALAAAGREVVNDITLGDQATTGYLAFVDRKRKEYQDLLDSLGRAEDKISDGYLRSY